MLTGFDRTAEPESFDVITSFDAVHDQARPLDVLKGHPSRPEARWPLPDAGHPRFGPRPQEHRPSPRHLPLHLLDHALHDSVARPGRRRPGRDVGEQKTRGYLEKARFRSIETHRPAHDIANNWYVMRK
jgi:hypothetical protein